MCVCVLIINWYLHEPLKVILIKAWMTLIIQWIWQLNVGTPASGFRLKTPLWISDPADGIRGKFVSSPVLVFE